MCDVCMDIKKGLHFLLKDILVNGDLISKDDAEIREYLGNHIFIDNPCKNKSLKNFYNDIKKGVYDLQYYGLKGDALAEYVGAVDNHEQIFLDGENSFVYSYPNRIFHQEHNEDMVNQYYIMLGRLADNIGSNRSVATIYNPFLDCTEEDIPCLNWLQATVRHNELILHCMFRSNDIFGAWYGNMLFLTYFGLKFTEELNKDSNCNVFFKGIDYHSSSAHVYEINVPDAWKLYKETGVNS